MGFLGHGDPPEVVNSLSILPNIQDELFFSFLPRIHTFWPELVGFWPLALLNKLKPALDMILGPPTPAFYLNCILFKLFVDLN